MNLGSEGGPSSLDRRTGGYARVLPYLVIALVIVFQLQRTWSSVSPFNGPGGDGPFQLYNGLRRLDAGQLPGRDFPSFHGLGLPFLHYPVYRLLGGDLYASELVRQGMSRFLSIVVYLFTSWLLTRSLWPGVVWSLLGVVQAEDGGAQLPWILRTLREFASSFAVNPGNSLLGLRALVPLLFVGLVYRSPRDWRGALGLGFTLAVGWMLGIEQGLYLFAAVFLTWVGVTLVRWRRPVLTGRPPILKSLLVGVVIAAVFLVACAQDHAAAVLRYYFVLIPGDQIWYFGVPPTNFLGDGSDLSRYVANRMIIFFTISSISWLWALWTVRQTTDPDQLQFSIAAMIGLGYAIFSLTSNFGMTIGGYLAVTLRMLLVLGTVVLYRLTVDNRERFVKALHFTRGGRVATLTAVILLIAAVGGSAVYAWAQATPRRLADRFQTITSEFSTVIKATCPKPRTGDVWSLYSGLVEGELGILNPEIDYAIHALGEMRDAYIRDFGLVRPQFVITFPRNLSKWEEWLETKIWGFYELLLANYEVAAASNGSLLWRRTERPWIEPSAGPVKWTHVPVAAGQNDIEIPAGPKDAQIAVVRLHYEVTNPLRIVPIFGQQGRYMVNSVNTRNQHGASVPPRQTDYEFPVWVVPGEPFSLQFRIQGLAVGASFNVKEVSVRYLVVPPVNRPFL